MKACVTILLMAAWLEGASQPYDVVIYAATSGGAIAAIAAAQQGRSVALLEPGRHIGGMISGGLGRTDMDRQQNVIGGMAREFFERVGNVYGEPVAWFFEPHVAEQVLDSWVKSAGVHVFFGSRLTAVSKRGARITSLRTSDGTEFQGVVFIDASYEGDLLKAAGVSYSVGRESVSKYGESLAGRQDILPGAHQFRAPVSPYDDNGRLLPFITAEKDMAPTGEGDGHVQSYCFRICLTNDPANRIPIEAPDGYDPKAFTLARRYVEALGDSASVKDFLGISQLPHNKTDINSTGAVSTDVPSLSWKYVEAGWAERERIRQAHLDWAHGLLYFLAHDESVPERLRREVSEWGLPKDEFADTGHWPHQLYVRDARRMLGEYVMAQHDLQEHRAKPDSIGMGGYSIDIREVQWIAHRVYRFPRADEEVLMEGYLSFPVEPYEIPYRTLVPRERECTNLIVPVCISASHIAYGSFRMEPQYMIAGQAAGLAAVLAVRSHSNVQRVNVQAL
ncbi:MAG: FAD-dependent oxidoreductase, partial [Acidobacteriaceae bacterium]|nr:FAD-dependent oxidoreductase [Acidobacteriaceae bacterium]